MKSNEKKSTVHSVIFGLLAGLFFGFVVVGTAYRFLIYKFFDVGDNGNIFFSVIYFVLVIATIIICLKLSINLSNSENKN